MKVSIIIPSQNSHATIADCVDSIMNCKLKSMVEIIIVDDHSQDDIWNVYKIVKNKYQNVTIIINDGKGVSSARNTGIKASNGDIIGFCDADDKYAEGVIDEVIYNFINNTSIDVLVGSVKQVKNNFLDIFRVRRNNPILINNNEIYIKKTLLNASFMGAVWNKFYKKELLKEVFFNNTIEFCEDTFFNVSVAKKNDTLRTKLVSKVFYYYISNNNSITNNKDKLFDEDGNLRYINTLMQIRNVFELTKNEIEYINCAMCYAALDNLRFTMCDKKRKRILKNIINKNLKLFIYYRNEYGILRFITHVTRIWI